MFKLAATLRKDLRILFRDKLGLLFMFIMPVILAILITAVQNSTFDLVNNNKIKVLIEDKDQADCSRALLAEIKKSGIFDISFTTKKNLDASEEMREKDAMVAILIPHGYSGTVRNKSSALTNSILQGLGLEGKPLKKEFSTNEQIVLLYHPVLQESFRSSVRGAVNGAIQITENKELLHHLYSFFGQRSDADSLLAKMNPQKAAFSEQTVTRDGSRTTPNATQHNIPAWTIFAMFFVVISLGSSIVKEKISGSFMRLKTMPGSFLISLISKQLTYLFVTILQAAVIFLLGIYFFPILGLPSLSLPADLLSLLLVTILCGLCAVSFAMCIGVFSATQEQNNGIGAVAVVLLAATGGIIVPSFVLPASFAALLKFSPMHWCLESYYVLFLEQGKFNDIFTALIPLVGIIFFLQLVALSGLRIKKLI